MQYSFPLAPLLSKLSALGMYLIAAGSAVNYEGMNITGVTGLTTAQLVTLKALGAVEDRE